MTPKATRITPNGGIISTLDEVHKTKSCLTLLPLLPRYKGK
ncbi:hypothetical protein IC582_024096 [Cucumis melo]